MRRASNVTLARIYRSPAIADIYTMWFGSLGQPPPCCARRTDLAAFPSERVGCAIISVSVGA
jgi:hypothetical protein